MPNYVLNRISLSGSEEEIKKALTAEYGALFSLKGDSLSDWEFTTVNEF